MPFLTVFKGSFTNFLKGNIKTNLTNYRRDDKWVQEVGTRTTRDLETRLELKSNLTLDDPEKNDLKDLENAIRVHKLLKHLTPVQARDPRIWARLCHVECWSYMRERWPLERFSDAEKGVRFITARYFVAQNESRALLRNGVARLWWTAHMTYDSRRDNPYELTAVLLSRLDIAQQLLERNMGRAPALTFGFLNLLFENKDLLLGGGDKNRARIRRMAAFLNMYGGACLLDSLTETEIIKLLGGELERILASEKDSKAAKAK